MGRTLLLPPHADLIEYVADFIYKGYKEQGESPQDYSGTIVVFPGRRPAHFLRKSLALRTGKGFIPPKIFSMDDFIDYVYEDVLGIKDRKIGNLDAIAILYEIHIKNPKSLGGNKFLKIEDFIGIGTRLFRDLEECLIEDINHGKLQNITMSPFDFSNETAAKFQSFANFFREFYTEIQNRGFSTRSMRYKRVSESRLELAGLKNIILAGFQVLTVTEERILRNLLSYPESIIIFQDTEITRKEIEKYPSYETVQWSEQPHDCEIEIYKSPDSHGQIFVLAEKIKALKDAGQINERTLIVVPGVELLMPLLHHCLSILDEKEYNISMGYPLYRTPIFAFYESLMEVVSSTVEGRVYVPAYLKFVLHPYTKNIYFKRDGEKRPEVTRILFHSIEGLLNEKGRVFVRFEEIEGAVDDIFMDNNKDSELLSISRDSLKAHLRDIHYNTIEKFSDFSDVADMARRSAEILMYIYHDSTASHHAFFYPFSEGFLNAFDELERSLFGSVKFDSITGYFNFFKRFIKTRSIPFEGTPLRGIQVLGFLETRNIKFERVFFLNLNEGIIPEGRRDDSLLPQKVRESLGLSTYRKRDTLAGAYFDLLLKGATEVHLFYVENDKAERSRFIEKIIWEREKKEGRIDTGRFVRPIKYNIKLDNPVPEPVKKTEPVINLLNEVHYSATQIDDYIKCPLRFYYRYILKLGKREEITPDPERKDIGIIVHQVMGRFFQPLIGITLKEEHLDISNLNNIIDRVFENHYGGEITGSYYLIKRQVKRRMVEVVNKYYRRFIEEGVNIETIAIERDIKKIFHGYRLKGVIDRIEKRRFSGSDEVIALLDYKISSTKNHWQISFNRLDIEDRRSWSDSIGSIQIPMYMLLCEGLFDLPVRGYYLLLGKGRLDRDAEFEVIKTSEEYNKIKDLIRRVLDEIVDPAVAFEPTTDLRRNCPDCLYQDICGTQWIKGYTY